MNKRLDKSRVSLIAGVTGGRGLAMALAVAMAHQRASMDTPNAPTYIKPIRPKPRPPAVKKLRKLKSGKARL